MKSKDYFSTQVNHKRYFGIECQDFEYSVQFVFDEPEAAKYYPFYFHTTCMISHCLGAEYAHFTFF